MAKASAKKKQLKTGGTVKLQAAIDLVSGKAPTEIRLLRFGVNESDYGPYTFDEIAAAMVMEAFRQKGIPRIYADWNHGMLRDQPSREDGEAACSFVPEVRDGELWAADIQWNEDGRESVESKKYNLFSPAFAWELGSDGVCRPRALLNFALVNRAGLDDIMPLLAASASNENEENDMEYEKLYNEQKSRADALEIENKALRGSSAEVVTLKAQVATLTTENSTLKPAASEIVALAAATGLRSDVPSTERVALVTGLVALRADVFKISGKDNLAEATGVLEGHKAKALGYDKLAAESAERESAALVAELSAALDAGVNEGKIMPALRATWEEDALAYGGGKPSTAGIAKLKAKLVQSPKVVQMAAAGGGTLSPAGGVVLTPERIAIAKQMGRSIAEVQAYEIKRLGAS